MLLGPEERKYSRAFLAIRSLRTKSAAEEEFLHSKLLNRALAMAKMVLLSLKRMSIWSLAAERFVVGGSFLLRVVY